MPIDPGIIAGLKQPQFDTSGILNVIAQGQQRRIALENHRQQTELHQQAIAAGERAAKAADLKLSEDAISRGALQESGGDMDKYVELVRQRAKSPDTIQAAQTHQQAILKGALANQKEQGAVTDAKNERMAGLIDQAAALKKTDPAAYAQSFPQIHADIKSIDPDAASHLDPSDPESLHLPAFALHYASLKWGKQAAEEGRAQAEELRKVEGEKQASLMRPEQLRELKAKASAAESDAAIKQFEVDAARATPEQQAAKVAATIDQTKYPEIYKRTLANVTSGVTHQEKMSALHAGSAEVAEREKETDPALRNARVATAVATEQALTPLKIRQAVDIEVAKARASGDAFGGITDPVERHRAEEQYAKDTKEFFGKVSEARRLKDLISAAQKGNKAAPGVIPIEELRSFVNRVNAQELKAVGPGAGSLMDQIEGKIGKLAKGQPIPPDLLKDMGELADLNEKAAERGYNFNLQIIRQKGAKVQAMKPEDVFGKSGGKVTMVAPDGTTKEVEPGEVDHYEKLGAKRK